MANIKKRYSSFNDWLQCCHGQSPIRAKAVASYLRQQEDYGLFSRAKVEGSYARIHTILNNIDNGTAKPNALTDVVKDLKKLYTQLKDEAYSTEIEATVETCKGWRQAFNLYMQFLAEVTDCFNYDHVLSVNSRVRLMHRTGREKVQYEKRLRIFRSGAYRSFFKELTDKTWGKLLDQLTEAIDTVVAQKGSLQVLTSFVCQPEEVSRIVNWREIALDTLAEIDYDEFRCPKSVRITKKYPVSQIIYTKTHALSEALLTTEILKHIVKRFNMGRDVEALNQSDSTLTRNLPSQLESVRYSIHEYFNCFDFTLEYYDF